MFLCCSIYLYNWLEIHALKQTEIVDNSFYYDKEYESKSNQLFLKKVNIKFQNAFDNFENDNKYTSKYILSENKDLIKGLSMLNLNKKIFTHYNNSDILTNKLKFHKQLYNYYNSMNDELSSSETVINSMSPNTVLKSLIPNTFALSQDYSKLLNHDYEINEKGIYIFKEPIKKKYKMNNNNELYEQNMSNIVINNKIPSLDILNRQNLKIVQEFLTDSLTFKNHKVSPRIYVMVEFKNNDLNIFLYKNGIIRYSNKPIDLIDKSNYSIYDIQKSYSNSNIGISSFMNFFNEQEFPNTLETFFNPCYKSYINNSNSELMNLDNIELEKIFWKKCSSKLQMIFKAFSSKIRGSEYNFVQIFGIDLFINNNFDPLILSIHEIGENDLITSNSFDTLLVNSFYQLIIDHYVNNKWEKILI